MAQEPPASDAAALRLWMQAAQQGDEQAFAQVVCALGGRLQRFFTHVGVPAGETEDLAQETLIRLYRCRADYDARYAVTTWALTIGRRLAVDQWRRRRREVPLLEADELAAPPGPAAAADDVWRLARRLLPARQYEALWLCYGEGEDLKAVARIMGLSAIHARVLVHRGRRGLAQGLREDAAAGKVRTAVAPRSPAGARACATEVPS